MSSRRHVAYLLVAAFAFGVLAAWVKGPGGAGDVSEIRSAIGNLSAPWLLVAFVAGTGFSRLPSGVLAGLLATMAAPGWGLSAESSTAQIAVYAGEFILGLAVLLVAALRARTSLGQSSFFRATIL